MNRLLSLIVMAAILACGVVTGADAQTLRNVQITSSPLACRAVTTTANDGSAASGWSCGTFTIDPNTGMAAGAAPSTARVVSSAASTNSTNVKSSACVARSVFGYNAAAAIRYVKLYNKATAPVVGTDVPILTVLVPATSSFSVPLPGNGLYFPLGCGFAFTVGGADSDTAAVTAGDILGFNVAYN